MLRPVVGPLDCELRNVPATSALLGKRGLAVRHAAGWTCPRDVLEVLEAHADVPLPARCGFWAHGDGVAVELVVARADADARDTIAQALIAAGVPLRVVHLHASAQQLRHPLPLRGDLREHGVDGADTAGAWKRELAATRGERRRVYGGHDA